MKDAKSSRDLWMTVSNDEAFRLQVWMQAASGRWAALMDDDSPEAWQTAQSIVAALERSVLMINYLLASTEASTTDDVQALQQWFTGAGPSTIRPEQLISQSILEQLLMHLVGMGSGGKRAGGFELNELVILRNEEPYTVRWPGRTFEVFVSYRHIRDGELVTSLVEQLEALGLECWLDRRQLALDPDSVVLDAVLKRWLREALTASTCTVFFETALEATADEDFRGHRVAFSWQVYEQRYARNVVYVRSGQRQAYFEDHTTAAWGTMPELAQLIAEHVRGLPAAGQTNPLASEEQADLVRAAEGLLRHGREYDAGLASIAPLAALALLAPRSIHVNTGETAPGADDVLLTLARYDPSAAMALQAAGIDLYAMFAAGSKIFLGRWSDSTEFRWNDAFGYGHSQQQLPAVVTETDLLEGIAAGVTSGAGYPAALLRRSLRITHDLWPKDEVDQAVVGTGQQVTGWATKNRRVQPCRHGRHGWLVLRASDSLMVVPVVRFGVYQLAEDCSPLPLSAAVYVRQARYLYPEHVMADIESVLNEDVAPGPVDDLLERRPEFALTFTGPPVPCVVHVLLTVDNEPSLVVLDADEIRADHCGQQPSPPPDAGNLAQVLRQLGPPGPASIQSRWPIHAAQALNGVLISEPCTLPPAKPELSQLGLLADMLSPLQRYCYLRELDYDDF